MPFKQSVRNNHRNHKWADEVKMRVLDCHDLVASEARYHITCTERFSLNNDQKSSNATTVGRPACNVEQENFDILCKWLESEAEIYSMSEIYSRMVELVGENKDIYTKRWPKTKLKIKYREHTMFTKAPGKPSVVCFKNLTAFIVNDK